MLNRIQPWTHDGTKRGLRYGLFAANASRLCHHRQQDSERWQFGDLGGVNTPRVATELVKCSMHIHTSICH